MTLSLPSGNTNADRIAGTNSLGDASSTNLEPVPLIAPDSTLQSKPNFERMNGAYAETARIAGRMNAAKVTDEEIQRLLDERELLLDKKFEGGLSPREVRRLTYIEWSLDTIEDARHGARLDMLEAAVGVYESFTKDLKDLLHRLGVSGPTNKRK